MDCEVNADVMSVDDSGDQQIVTESVVNLSGQATVGLSVADVLCDLAVKTERPPNPPVDVEHVLAAGNGEFDRNTPLSSDDSSLAEVLVDHIKTVLADYDGNVGMDE